MHSGSKPIKIYLEKRKKEDLERGGGEWRDDSVIKGEAHNQK